MALHSGIDTVGFVSDGDYTKTYGSGDRGIVNLFASDGMMEDLPLADRGIVIDEFGNIYYRIRNFIIKM